MEDEAFEEAETKIWIGKHFPVSAPITSNLSKHPIFLCDITPLNLVSSFIEALENVPIESKAQTKKKFLQVETTVRSELAENFETLNHIAPIEKKSTRTVSKTVLKMFQHSFYKR